MLLESRFTSVGPTAAALDAVLKGRRTALWLLVGGLLFIVEEELAKLIVEDLLVCLAI